MSKQLKLKTMGNKKLKPAKAAQIAKTKRMKLKMLKALEENRCLITTSCKAIGINRTTYYDWFNNDPEFAAKVEVIRDIKVEAVRSKLDELISKGNPAGIIFYLKNKDPEFAPKIQVSGKDGGPIKVTSIFDSDLIIKPNQEVKEED